MVELNQIGCLLEAARGLFAIVETSNGHALEFVVNLVYCRVGGDGTTVFCRKPIIKNIRREKNPCK